VFRNAGKSGDVSPFSMFDQPASVKVPGAVSAGKTPAKPR
jgi:hypothetical protein